MCFTSQPLNATCDAAPWLSHGAKHATTANLLFCGLIIIKEEAGFTRLHQARHSGHGWAVSGGSAEVGGAAGPLPAALMGRLHAVTEKTETENNRFGFCFGKQRLQTKPGLAQARAPIPGIGAVLPVWTTLTGSTLLPGALPLILLFILLQARATTPGQASLPRSNCRRILDYKMRTSIQIRCGGEHFSGTHAGWLSGGAAAPDWSGGWNRC